MPLIGDCSNANSYICKEYSFQKQWKFDTSWTCTPWPMEIELACNSATRYTLEMKPVIPIMALIMRMGPHDEWLEKITFIFFLCILYIGQAFFEIPFVSDERRISNEPIHLNNFWTVSERQTDKGWMRSYEKELLWIMKNVDNVWTVSDSDTTESVCKLSADEVYFHLIAGLRAEAPICHNSQTRRRHKLLRVRKTVPTGVVR